MMYQELFCETHKDIMIYPNGSRFIRVNTNDKGEAIVLDQLLDGTDHTPIGINGAQVDPTTLQITHITFTAGIAFVIVSPRGAIAAEIPTENN